MTNPSSISPTAWQDQIAMALLLASGPIESELSLFDAIDVAVELACKAFIDSPVLPTEFGAGKRSDLEAAGVVFGDIVPGKPYLTFVTLPEGWRKLASGASDYSTLVDDQDRIRAELYLSYDGPSKGWRATTIVHED